MAHAFFSNRSTGAINQDTGPPTQHAHNKDYALELRRHKLENELKVQQLCNQIRQAEQLQEERYRRLEDAKERILNAEERVENSLRIRLELEDELLKERSKNFSNSVSSSYEMKMLLKRLKDVEKRTTIEQRECKDLNESIVTLNAELEAAKKSTSKLERSKIDLESQVSIVWKIWGLRIDVFF